MSKKVMVIETSIRNGSNTDLMAERFAAGARDAGNEVEVESLKGDAVRYCRGCYACKRNGRCVISDNARNVVDRMGKADVVVFATPVYFYGMSGQMKTLLDRTMPLYWPVAGRRFTDVYLLVAGEDTVDTLPDGVIDDVQRWASCFDGVELKNGICAYGTLDPKSVSEEYLQQCYDLGRSISRSCRPARIRSRRARCPRGGGSPASEDELLLDDPGLLVLQADAVEERFRTPLICFPPPG